MAFPDLGEPLTGSYTIPDGTARLFTNGVTIQHGGGEVIVAFRLPTLGRPSIVSLDPPTPLFEPNAISFNAAGHDPRAVARLIADALAGRLVLAATGQAGQQIPLTLTDRVSVDGPLHQVEVALPALAERQLYDVALLTESGQWRTVAPHAVYFRSAWRDFGFVHVTDIHVSKRIDRFRGLLLAAERPEAAQRVHNWNDRFRGFIRFANYLHSIGKLDVILSTGDQYDYMFEDGEDQALGGNAAFFRLLVLGYAPGPDFLDVEELRVPIFLTTGNHDYRKHAYKLIFDIYVGSDVIGDDVATIKNYGAFNLHEDEARSLERRLSARPDLPEFPFNDNLSPSQASRMVEVDEALRTHHQHLADKTSYVVALGPHRVAMIDSGPDTGVLSSVMDGLRQLIGLTSEDEDTFAAGSPNCKGVSPDDLEMVKDALANAPDHGLFIVGIHAPLLSPINNEFGYFLRETQRPQQMAQVKLFLWRHAMPFPLTEPIESEHPKWFSAADEHEPVAFVVRGDRNDLLDFGVSRGRADQLIEALAGSGGRRADLALSGHGHYHNEFSVRRLPSGELGFFMDHYTESVTNYYPSRFCNKFRGEFPLEFSETSVEVVPDGAADASPSPIAERRWKYDLRVPPYADPLNASPDPRSWWAAHRPLLMQTPALGPRKTFDFLSGFRLFLVGNNTIVKSHYISIARLEAHGFRLPLEEAIAPEPTGPGEPPWLSVSEGATRPGARVSPVDTGNGITLVVVEPSGGVYASHGSNRGGWGPWQGVSEGSTGPGGQITAVRVGDKVALFAADIAGGVYTCLGDYHRGWGPWRNVSEGSTVPGGYIAAVPFRGRVHIFLADPAGGIYVNAGTYDTGWGPWRNVSEGASTPGAPLAAIADGNRITVVLADPGGGVFASAGSYEDGWGPWRPVSEGATTPRGHVTGIHDGSRIRLYVADIGGGVYVAAGHYQSGWSAWTSVSEGATLPGAPVSATVRNDRVHVFLADRGGGVYTSVSRTTGPAGMWQNVSEGATTPGGFVTAVTTNDGVTAFVADPGGGIFARLIS